MRFTLIKDLSKDNTMRPILTGLLIFTLFYLVSDILVKHLNFGIFPDTIHLTLYGDENQYIDPLSKASFLEFWHVEIFFMMMILLTLSAIFIRLLKHSAYKIIITNIVMISAILSLILLALSYFVSDTFIPLYAICFFTWHIFAIYMALISIWNLYYDKSI